VTATRIVFGADISLVVSVDLDSIQDSVYEAISNGGWMILRVNNGPSVSINPSSILYMEELSPEDGGMSISR
jgi:hypothetical protein